MSTHHVAFAATVPDRILAQTEAEDARRARSFLLSQGWYERRRIDWTCSLAPAPESGQSLNRHEAVLALDCADSASPTEGRLTVSVTVSVRQGEDPLEKARRVHEPPDR